MNKCRRNAARKRRRSLRLSIELEKIKQWWRDKMDRNESQ